MHKHRPRPGSDLWLQLQRLQKCQENQPDGAECPGETPGTSSLSLGFLSVSSHMVSFFFSFFFVSESGKLNQESSRDDITKRRM